MFIYSYSVLRSLFDLINLVSQVIQNVFCDIWNICWVYEIFFKLDLNGITNTTLLLKEGNSAIPNEWQYYLYILLINPGHLFTIAKINNFHFCRYFIIYLKQLKLRVCNITPTTHIQPSSKSTRKSNTKRREHRETMPPQSPVVICIRIIWLFSVQLLPIIKQSGTFAVRGLNLGCINYVALLLFSVFHYHPRKMLQHRNEDGTR